jgi:hypothetical protein
MGSSGSRPLGRSTARTTLGNDAFQDQVSVVAQFLLCSDTEEGAMHDQARHSIADYLNWYNQRQPHSGLRTGRSMKLTS